jgi:hypothetical protein
MWDLQKKNKNSKKHQPGHLQRIALIAFVEFWWNVAFTSTFDC